MKSITLHRPGVLAFAENAAAETVLQPHEAQVRVRRVGICGTDLHAFEGVQPFFTYPRVLGHELGVEVLQVGAEAINVKAGDRCAVEPYIYCGMCGACRRGKTNCCVRLQVLGVHADGGMCETLIVPARNLHSSRVLSFDQLALVEPLCIGAHAVERAGIEAGEQALIIGAGPIGLAVTQFARARGARIIALDVNAKRLAFAREHFGGIDATVNAGDGDVMEKLEALTDGELPTVVFDATGNARSMAAAFDFPAHGGRLVFVGLFQGDITFHDPDAHRRELTLLCSRNATGADFRCVMRLMEDDAIDIRPWITHRVAFDADTGTHFPAWLDPRNKFIKAVVEM